MAPMFGKYEIGKLLGSGAFAKVYHARNVLTGESVAIKVINKKKLLGTTLMSNIKREISIMSKLNHPNIVKLYEVLGSKTKIYFVMEFVKGGHLFAKVSNGRLTEKLSRKYFRQLISVLRYCHSRGVYHRDLKLENLLIDDNGDLKVTDFGLSAVTDHVRADGFLHTICGTWTYVAPEIPIQNGYDGAKVDVWSSGVVLFVLAAGYFPFNDTNIMALYKKIYKGEFQCPKRMSPDLQRLICRLLDTNPATRITVDEILQDPWFKNGSKLKTFNNNGNFESKSEEDEQKVTTLNAFDLISFSSGLDLAGLFDDSYNSVDDGERFVSSDSPEKALQRFEDFGKVEKLRVKRKKKLGVEIESQNGDLVIGVEINRLTDELVVVEVKRRGGNARCYRDIWEEKLKPELCGLMG